MDLDFDPLFQCWGEFYLYTKMYTLQLNTSRIHPNSEKRDQNPSLSKVVTFLYVGTYMSLSVYIYEARKRRAKLIEILWNNAK